MKIRNLILGAFALLGVFSSCQGTVDADPAVKIISESELSVSQDGGTQTITFTSATDWSVRGLDDVDWITISPESGKGSASEQKITVQVAPNSGADREASLTIYASPLAKKVVFISQKGPLGDGVVTMTVKEFIDAASSSARCRLTGTISGLFTSTFTTFNLVDETGSILVYSYATENTIDPATLKNGGTVTLTGIYAYYESKSQHEVTKAIIEDYTAPAEVDPSTIQQITCQEFITKADPNTDYRLVGKVASSVNASYCSFDLNDGTATVVVWTVNNKDEWKDVVKQNGTVTVRGKYLRYEKDGAVKHEMVDAYIEKFEEAAPAEKVKASGLVMAASKAGFIFQETSGQHRYAFDSQTACTVKVGDMVEVEGDDSMYGQTPEISPYTVTVKSSGNAVTYPAAADVNGAALDSYTGAIFSYVKFSGKLAISGNYNNVTVTGATKVGSLANATVDAALNGKIVDCEGYYIGLTGSDKYFNIVLTKIALSADQTGADEGGSTGGGSEGGSTGDASLTPGENEVLHVLTNAEILAQLAKSTSATYTDVTVPSAGGDWVGNIYNDAKNTFLQFRNNNASYLTSPTYSTDVKRIVIVASESKFKQSTKKDLRVCAVPVVDPKTLPTGKGSDNKNINYGDAQMAGAYGTVTVSTQGGAQTLGMDVTTSIKQFSLLTIDGAMYLDAIYVFCAK